MPLNKINLRPDYPGFSVTMASSLLIAQVDGGPPRTRVDVLGQWNQVSVQWSTDPAGYEYLQQARRFTEVNGGAHFLLDFYLNHGTVTECECMFVPNTFKLISVAGRLMVVKADLLVKPGVGDDATWPVDSDFQGSLLTDSGTPLII